MKTEKEKLDEQIGEELSEKIFKNIKEYLSKDKRELVKLDGEIVLGKIKEDIIAFGKMVPRLHHRFLTKHTNIEKLYRLLKSKFAYVRRWHNAIYQVNVKK